MDKEFISIDSVGQIEWTNPLLTYDANLFTRGKTVTNAAFNDLFLKQTWHSNYVSKSLKELITKLPGAVSNYVQHTFDVALSYVKTFGLEDWGTPAEDGYYYLNIPASEHNVVPDENDSEKRLNVEAKMYALDKNGTFYEINQIALDDENNVQLYTDDNTLIGYVVIRINSKAYAVLETDQIPANKIKGLAPVAVSGRYSDLYGAPDLKDVEQIQTNADNIAAIIKGTKKVKLAEDVLHITTDTTFDGIEYTQIFEAGSKSVKKATYAESAGSATNATNATNATTVTDNIKIGSTTKAITAIFNTDGSVKNATKATNATNADNLTKGIMYGSATYLLSDIFTEYFENASNPTKYFGACYAERAKSAYSAEVAEYTDFTNSEWYSCRVNEESSNELPTTMKRGHTYEMYYNIGAKCYSFGVFTILQTEDIVYSPESSNGTFLVFTYTTSYGAHFQVRVNDTATSGGTLYYREIR
jgi:hypothetical protein